MNYYKDGKLSDYYEILEVHRMASNEIINRAFKVLAKKYHPDLNNDSIDYANSKMSDINEAYEVLNDEGLRSEYNLLYDSIILNKYYKKENSSSDDTTIKDNKNQNQYYEQYNNYNKTTQPKNKYIFKYIIAATVIFAIVKAISSDLFALDSQQTSNNNVYSAVNNDEPTDNLFLNLKSQNETMILDGYNDFTKNYTSEEALVGFIIKGNTEVKSGPSNDYENIYSFMDEDMIIVVGTMNNWYEIYVITDNNGLFGWVPTDNLDTYWYNMTSQQFVEHTINQTLENNTVNNPVDNKVDNTETTENISTSSSYFFTLGSTQEDVKNIMGTPDSINDYYSFVQWNYDFSSIKFSTSGKVIAWNDISGNLKVYMGDKDINSPAITLGSIEQDVLDAMGTPDSINDYYNFIEWGYDFSSIKFNTSGKVIGWNDISNNLKVYLGDKDINSLAITLGSTEQDVLDAMGTPDSINDYYSFTEWGYDFSSVKFDKNGKVIGWNDISKNLKIE